MREHQNKLFNGVLNGQIREFLFLRQNPGRFPRQTCFCTLMPLKCMCEGVFPSEDEGKIIIAKARYDKRRMFFFLRVLHFGWPNQPSSGIMANLHWKRLYMGNFLIVIPETK